MKIIGHQAGKITGYNAKGAYKTSLENPSKALTNNTILLMSGWVDLFF